MLIKGAEVKKGHLWFFLTSIIGLVNGIHTVLIARQGAPPSEIIHMVYVSNIVIVFTAVIAPLVAVYILINKLGASLTSRIFWVSMVMGVSLCLIVIVRGMTWLLLEQEKQFKDLKSFLYLREKKSEHPGDITIYTSRKEGCCGITSFVDWEEIYVEVDAYKKDFRPRKLPDFCCKNATYGCGTRYLTEIYDKMEFIVSNCYDLDKEHSKDCLDAEIDLDPYVKGWNISSLPHKVDLKRPKRVVYLVNITDPRIETAHHKESIAEQPAVHAICRLKVPDSFFVSVMFYYKGYVKEVTLQHAANLRQIVKKPCFPIEIAVQNCKYELVAVNYFRHAFGFCSWLNFRDDENKSRFSIKEREELAAFDGRLFYKGCGETIAKFVNKYTLVVVIYCVILLCLFSILMHHYHKYYFDFRSPMLQTMPMPRWYEPLPHEVPLMHSFGDVDFIVDGNCKQLPPIPCRLEEEMALDDNPDVTEGLTVKLDDVLKVDAEAAAKEQN